MDKDEALRQAYYVMRHAKCGFTDPQLRAEWAQRRRKAMTEISEHFGWVDPDLMR